MAITVIKMLKNERKGKIESKKFIMTEKVINLNELLEKPNSFKKTLNSNDNCFKQQNYKPKFFSDKSQNILKYVKSIKEESKSENSGLKLVKTERKSDKINSDSRTFRSNIKNPISEEFKLNGENFKKFLDKIEKDTIKKLGEKDLPNVNEKNNGIKVQNNFPVIIDRLTNKIDLPTNFKYLSPWNNSSDKPVRPNSEYMLKSNSTNKILTTNEYLKRPYSNAKTITHDDNSISKNDYNSESLFRGRIEDYQMGKELGKGAYAIVKNALHKPSKLKIAIKIYDKYKLHDPQRKSSVNREIMILKKIDHPNIVKLFEVIDSSKQILLIMELVSGVSLLNFLKSKPDRKIEEKICKEIYQQVINGIKFCHSMNIYHRDIKLENLIVDEKNNIKIIDFGFSANSPKNQYLSFFCGTPSYMPPEIIQKKDYLGPNADIWSCGILLYAMLCGSFPFRGILSSKIAINEKELYSKITKGVYSLPDYLSESAKSIIKKILIVNPINRPSAIEILQDEWFKI